MWNLHTLPTKHLLLHKSFANGFVCRSRDPVVPLINNAREETRVKNGHAENLQLRLRIGLMTEQRTSLDSSLDRKSSASESVTFLHRKTRTLARCL
jgi:hypothetical protein